jgi:hypothetical protein
LHEELKGQADYVLLMNVLHEIAPLRWETVLKDEIRPLLTKDGKLFIIEVEELDRGENASSCGFLVLTENASRKLFGNDVFIKKPESKKNGKRRISAYIVGSEQLKNVCFANIRKCVELIKNEAMETITEIRKRSILEEDLYREGMHHAFWLHQYANASIALDSFKNSNYENTN